MRIHLCCVCLCEPCVQRLQEADFVVEGSCGVLCCNGTAVRRLLSLPFNLICLLVAFGSVLDIGAEIECRLHIL